MTHITFMETPAYVLAPGSFRKAIDGDTPDGGPATRAVTDDGRAAVALGVGADVRAKLRAILEDA